MQKPTPKYHQILMELIRLRETDYDAFMDKLYEALSGEFREVVQDNSPVVEKNQAITTMIKYFSDREEYEKCADLKKMMDQLSTK